jgi:predicted phosphodiesterase
MDLAVVSDIHGNLTALEAVVDDISRRGVDHVVHGGDLALMGAQGAEVVDRVRELGWPGIVGNTEELLWRPELHESLLEGAPKLAPLLSLLFNEYAPATRELLGDERMLWMRGELPAEHHGDELAVVHASPGDLWRAPAADADDTSLTGTYSRYEAGLVVYGHIHTPYIRRIGGLTVANSGSVGAPFDGDPRASYLLVRDGREPELVRVEYDVDREAAVLLASGYPDAERLAAMRRAGRFLAVA